MTLVTKEIERKFAKFPYGSQEGKGKDAEVILKVFNPYGSGTWLVTEAWKEDGEWMAFGWVEMFGEWEMGYFSLKELQDVRINVFGTELGLERDRHCSGETVGELMAG